MPIVGNASLPCSGNILLVLLLLCHFAMTSEMYPSSESINGLMTRTKPRVFIALNDASRPTTSD